MEFKIRKLVNVMWVKCYKIFLEKSAFVGYVSSFLVKASNWKVKGGTRLAQKLITGRSRVFSKDHGGFSWSMLDPGSDIVLQWNRVFLVSCLLAMFIDPLYFYLPIIRRAEDSFCVDTDWTLQIGVTLLRTYADLFYILHMVIKFRTAYVAPSSRIFGRGELVMDPKKIAQRYIRSDFFIDLIAALPLPQVVIWFIVPITKHSRAVHDNNTLKLIVLLQYVPRLYLMFPLSSEIVKVTGVVTRTAWAGAAYNLLLFMLASHVLGAVWYLISLGMYTSCWKLVCRTEKDPLKCVSNFLNCDHFHTSDHKPWANNTHVFKKCNPLNDITFKYGIFETAITKKVISSNFIHKYFYCLWWGLQQLSSYGQNLSTTTFIGETLFAIIISIVGLILCAHLIGNMQTYLQSLTVRLEEWRVRRRDTEGWMTHRKLPEDLKRRVRRFVQYKWVATRGVDEETMVHALPEDVRRDIQRHLCLDLVLRVPFFSEMDDQLLDAICERLVCSLSTEGNYIVREGDPVGEMLFIIKGRLESSTTNGGRTGFFNTSTLGPGDFCGEELLAWALHPKSSSNLPSSTRTVKAHAEVEAFALRAEDLKFVASQFRRLHSKKLQHTFRYYSHHWRTWAACFIQAAWRRHKKKILSHLSMSDSFASNSSSDTTPITPPKFNFGVTVLASKFAANTRKGAQRIKDLDELPKLQKPDEPDFSSG